MKFLEGKKTYIGIATTVLGILLGEADVNMIVDILDKLIIVSGLLGTFYGRLKTQAGEKS